MQEDPIEVTHKHCPKVGEILGGRYRIERIIGVGGMGVVLSAIQLDLDRRVAVKVLVGDAAFDRESVTRLSREARALSRLTTSHVSRLLDVGTITTTGAPFLVMEYLEGQDLAKLLREEGAFPIEKTVLLALDACEALDEAHAEGIVHRDIKPSNMFLCTTAGGCLELKLLDFGISKAGISKAGIARGDSKDDDDDANNPDNKSLTRTSQLLGSPLYMSPEQLRATRDVDLRTDVWSLGVVLYELLTGRPPFDGESVADVCARIMVTPTPCAPLAKVPAGLADVVLRCLEKDPAKRFATVADLARALKPFTTTTATKATTNASNTKGVPDDDGNDVLLVPPFLSAAQRHVAFALASAITIAVLTLGAVGWLRPTSSSATATTTTGIVAMTTTPAAAALPVEPPPPEPVTATTPELMPEPNPPSQMTSSARGPSRPTSSTPKKEKESPQLAKVSKSDREPDIGY